jgi:hypothetical protein
MWYYHQPGRDVGNVYPVHSYSDGVLLHLHRWWWWWLLVLLLLPTLLLVVDIIFVEALEVRLDNFPPIIVLNTISKKWLVCEL